MSKRALLLGVVLLLVPRVAEGRGSPGTPSYLTPAGRDGMVFPVARSSWYSVINFRDDWHDPRMRLTTSGWQQIGVHEGNDIFAEPGTPVLAVLGGRIERIGWTYYSGWRVGVRGDDGRYWFYAHLDRFASGLGVGDRVEPGEALGRVGNTGYGQVPGHSDEFTYHLHIGIQAADGSWANPYPLMRRLYLGAVESTR